MVAEETIEDEWKVVKSIGPKMISNMRETKETIKTGNSTWCDNE